MVEALVSRLVSLHSAPTITAPDRSVTLPEMRALSVCANAATAVNRRIRIRTSTRHFIESLCAAQLLCFVLRVTKGLGSSPLGVLRPSDRNCSSGRRNNDSSRRLLVWLTSAVTGITVQCDSAHRLEQVEGFVRSSKGFEKNILV